MDASLEKRILPYKHRIEELRESVFLIQAELASKKSEMLSPVKDHEKFEFLEFEIERLESKLKQLESQAQ